MSNTKKKSKINRIQWEKWLKDNKVYILSFVMPFLTMFVIFFTAKIYPFGDRSFLHIDMYHQYFPFLVDFYHALKGTGEGSGIFYSWNAGLGSNFTALYTYYLASPLNMLCLLVPEMSLMEFMSYFVIIKIGICGLTSAYYLSKHFDTKNISVALFGMFYALSGYMAAYNWDVMWLDPIMLMPLVILGLEALAREGRYRLYTVTLALSILSNYYICIMLCIYLTIYFFAVLLPGAKKKIEATVRFACFSAVAGGMAAVLLIPEVMALQLSKFSASSFPKSFKTYFSIFDVLSRHLFDVAVETGLDHWPNIYCSVAVLGLIPLYVMCSRVNVREKITKVLIMSFFLISFSSNVLTYIWHGFNYPDSLPCRQSYLYIFLVLTMAYEAYMYIREYSWNQIWGTLAGVIFFIIMCQKLITDDGITGRSYLLSALFVCAYALILYMARSEKGGNGILYAAVLIVVLEAGLNTMLTSVPTVSRTNYLSNYRTYNRIYNEYNELDEGNFYRFDKTKRMTSNDAMLQNYMSASIFSSTSNGLVGSFYSNYGMRTSKVFACRDGATPFMDALLSVKYLYSKNDDEENSYLSKVMTEDNISLYAYNRSLPLGYMIYNSSAATDQLIEDKQTAFGIISGDVEDTDSGLNPVERQNELAIKLGATDDLYRYIDGRHSGSEATIDVPIDSYVVLYCNTKKVKNLKVTTSDGDETFGQLKNPYIVDLGYRYAGEQITARDEDGADLKLSAYSFNEDAYAELIDMLSQSTFKIDRFESTRVAGTIEATEDGYAIFSIPFDPGWSVYVDGKQVEAELFEEMMTAIPLTTGQHVIELKYMPQGLVAGAILSIILVACFAAFWVWDYRRQN